MNLRFVWSESSTKRGVVKAFIAIALIFGYEIPDESGNQILAGLFALEAAIGILMSDKEKKDV